MLLGLSTYLKKKVQPQKKGNTYCSIFSTKIQKFYKKSINLSSKSDIEE